MSINATFLHITDTHIAEAGTPLRRGDHKVNIPDIEHDTRESAIEKLFERLAERLTREGRTLDAVIFSGDAQDQGRPGGHAMLLEMLVRHFGPLGIAASRIVAMPGNHDVPRGSRPSSPERYQQFLDAWSKSSCVVPWLDGIDTLGDDVSRHRLVATDLTWSVYPINTSNWSHVDSILPEPLRSAWATLPELAAGSDPVRTGEIRSQLEKLARYDMARVSNNQLDALRRILSSTPTPTIGAQLRIAVMHHHLRAPSFREEIKPLSEITNVETIRALLLEQNVGILIHGHKHEHAAYFDYVPNRNDDTEHRVLVLSGATFDPERERDAARLIQLSGLPHTPSVTIEPIALPRPGLDSPLVPPIKRRLWTSKPPSNAPVSTIAGAPTVICGTDLDETYARACAIAEVDSARGTLIVHLDLDQGIGANLPLPDGYPAPASLLPEERQHWLDELVEWWQLGRSKLEHRIPYIHGGRLRQFGGKIDQVERIVRLLKVKDTTRALATLIDPFRDFGDGSGREEFASFCLVEFRLLTNGGARVLEAIAFYRAQELARWWPINVAELRSIQWYICREIQARPGRITTITADARTRSKTPTQVAMPIVDRWLDQAPEKLHLLANALVGIPYSGTGLGDVRRDWFRTLDDLAAATAEYNPDGIPLSIEGLETIASYLEVTASEEDEHATTIKQKLISLAKINNSFDRSACGPDDFHNWSAPAKELINDLRRLSRTRLAVGELDPDTMGSRTT